MDYKLILQRMGLLELVNIFTFLSGFILVPILTKGLTIEEYGIFSQIGITTTLIIPIATLNLTSASQRFLARENDKNLVNKGFSSIFAVIFATSLIISILMFISSKSIAIYIFGGENAEYIVKLVSLLALLKGIDASLDIFFLTSLLIKKYSYFSMLGSILQILFFSYSLYSGFRLYGVLISLMVVSVLSSILKFILITSQIEITFPNYSLIKDYLFFSIPTIPGTLGYLANNFGNRYIIGYFLGMASVGIFSVSYTLGSIILMFYMPISLIILSITTHLYKENNMQEIRTLLNYLLKGYLVIAIPSIFGLMVISKPLIKVMSSTNFISGAAMVPIIAIATTLYCSSLIIQTVLLLFKKTKIAGFISFSTAVVNIILNIILVPSIGIIGSAIAIMVTFSLHLFLTSYFSFKLLSFNIDLVFITKTIISSIIMAFVVWELDPISLIQILISIGMAAGIYIGSMLISRGFTEYEYTMFKNFVMLGVKK